MKAQIHRKIYNEIENEVYTQASSKILQEILLITKLVKLN